MRGWANERRRYFFIFCRVFLFVRSCCVENEFVDHEPWMESRCCCCSDSAFISLSFRAPLRAWSSLPVAAVLVAAADAVAFLSWVASELNSVVSYFQYTLVHFNRNYQYTESLINPWIPFQQLKKSFLGYWNTVQNCTIIMRHPRRSVGVQQNTFLSQALLA